MSSSHFVTKIFQSSCISLEKILKIFQFLRVEIHLSHSHSYLLAAIGCVLCELQENEAC
jgi:hypothetical protein